jgi:integrase
MSYARKQLPKYCLHKGTGRAFVRIEGKTYYLGKHGTAASRREYDRVIAEFIANGRQGFLDPDEILVEQLIIRFLDMAEVERNYSAGRMAKIVRILRHVDSLYGKEPVTSFTPVALKTIRRQYLDRNICRDTINSYMQIIKAVFDWGCEEEVVPATVAGALRTVKALQIGRTSAPEYRIVGPVADEIVELTLPHIKPLHAQDMVRVQRFISGRPQDVFNMRLADVDRSGEVWKYTPYTHKTKHRGKVRLLAIGPKAQQILQPYFDQCDNAEQFVFPRPKAKNINHWYGAKIANACKKADIPRWSPNQLRHAGGTEVRDKFGVEYAQAVLGHANIKTTEIYAKVMFEKAAKVAKEIG